MRRFLLWVFVLHVLQLHAEKLKVLHIGFHKGCVQELNYVAEQLNFDLTNWFVSDISEEEYGVPKGNNRYNVSHTMAAKIWDKNQDFFKSFDLIITSDTAPLSRIFLQNNFPKPLIIWVCNRFDYYDGQSLREPFPDCEYYNLIASIPKRPNVRIVSYTPFEHLYAKKHRKISFGDTTIKPIGYSWQDSQFQSSIPASIDKSNSFFVPNYHNDAILPKNLEKLGISYYKGRYAGPRDLKDFKGIIHIPYAWSNLALFENWSNGIVYFIPTKRFLLKLRETTDFFWSPPFDIELLTYSEWYLPTHANLFVYFDSWEDLRSKIDSANYSSMQHTIKDFLTSHKIKMLEEWSSVISSIVN